VQNTATKNKSIAMYVYGDTREYLLGFGDFVTGFASSAVTCPSIIPKTHINGNSQH
jgi:hypothetical protein